MRRFVEGIDRGQATLFPECLEDWIDEDNPIRVVDAFVDKLDLSRVGFDGVVAEATGRPSYHPAVLLKLYIYGYLNRVQSSRRLEREAGRNVEVMWLTGRLIPDHKTIADFRKDSGPAIKQVCVQFVELCRLMGLLTNGFFLYADDEIDVCRSARIAQFHSDAAVHPRIKPLSKLGKPRECPIRACLRFQQVWPQRSFHVPSCTSDLNVRTF